MELRVRLGKLAAEIVKVFLVTDKIFPIQSGFLTGNAISCNRIFDLTSPSNRDNCFEPYVKLREKFAKHNITLDTIDLVGGRVAAFEIHMDVRPRKTSGKQYLLLLETQCVYPPNGVTKNWKNYQKIFTWRDDIIDNNCFIKICLPNPTTRVHVTDGWAKRDRFCCLIAGNKTVSMRCTNELYAERVRAIRWFEENVPDDFDLYGVDWDLSPPICSGKIGKISLRLARYMTRVIRRNPFPSYRGTLFRKSDALRRTRYSLCYENIKDMPGYITEKIFDCFFSGCVPVYWGASNVTNYIPADCFIDRREFRDTESVYKYLRRIPEDKYRGYQERIAAFLESDAAYPFSSDAFAETIVNTIVSDLGR